MISTICDKGMIFLCTDKCMKKDGVPMKHNYLIINRSKTELGFVQAMSITSMSQKEIGMEVPIKLSNDYVSYIIPYNLHSFTTDEIGIDMFKGCLIDTPRISKDEFLKLLMDIYLLSIGMKTEDEVKPRYDEYCRQFWEEFKNCKEFRDVKEEQHRRFTKPDNHNTDISNDEINTIMNSIVGNTDEKIRDTQAITTSSNSSYRKKSTSKRGKHAHGKKGKKNKKETRDRDIEKMMRNTIGQSSSSNIPESPSKSMFSTGLQLKDMSVLSKAPKFIKDWSDNELILFIRGWNEYGYDALHQIIPDRWSIYGSMWASQKKAKEEAEKRNLLIVKDPLRRPMKEWSDKELNQYIAIMDNHKYDHEFQMAYTGFSTVNECNQLAYKVKKELQSRNLLV